MENKREAAVSFGGLATEVQESESYVMDVSKLCVYRPESEPKVLWRSTPSIYALSCGAESRAVSRCTEQRPC